MSARPNAEPAAVLRALVASMNAHDAERIAACFAADYRSVHPAHPGRTYAGHDSVRREWSAMFARYPTFRADVLATAQRGATIWAELQWTGDGPGQPPS